MPHSNSLKDVKRLCFGIDEEGQIRVMRSLTPLETLWC